MSALLDKVKGKSIGVEVGQNAVAVSFRSDSIRACQYYLLGIASTLSGIGKPYLALKVLSHMPAEGSSPGLLFEEKG